MGIINEVGSLRRVFKPGSMEREVVGVLYILKAWSSLLQVYLGYSISTH